MSARRQVWEIYALLESGADLYGSGKSLPRVGVGGGGSAGGSSAAGDDDTRIALGPLTQLAQEGSAAAATALHVLEQLATGACVEPLLCIDDAGPRFFSYPV